MNRIPIAFDMETSDPDDMVTLCMLTWHPAVMLRAVTVTPGTHEQIIHYRDLSVLFFFNYTKGLVVFYSIFLPPRKKLHSGFFYRHWMVMLVLSLPLSTRKE